MEFFFLFQFCEFEQFVSDALKLLPKNSSQLKSMYDFMQRFQLNVCIFGGNNSNTSILAFNKRSLQRSRRFMFDHVVLKRTAKNNRLYSQQANIIVTSSKRS